VFALWPIAAGYTSVGWDWVVVVQGTGSLEAHARELGSKSLFLFVVVKLAPPAVSLFAACKKRALGPGTGPLHRDLVSSSAHAMYGPQAEIWAFPTHHRTP
jgi:hypothetical protein